MSKEIEFLNPRFVGKRFEGHNIPLDVLKDLAVFEEMVKAAARLQYLQDHPDRERIPKGFYDGISIAIKDIGDGSAVPKMVIVLSTAVLSLFPPDSQICLEKARANIIQAIDAAEHGEEVNSLPDSVLTYFSRFGSSLRQGESLEFRPENSERPARLNRETRKKLILSSSQVQEYTEEIEVTGRVSESDHLKESFTLELRDGSTVTAPKDQTINEVILNAHSDFHKGQKIQVKGAGKYGRNGKLIKFETIEHIELLEALDVSERLLDLGELKEGWLDNGLGKPLDAEGLKWFEAAFNMYYDDAQLPLPNLFPTVEGNIQAEWTLGDWEISLEVDLITKSGEFQAVEIVADTQIDESLALDESDAWQKLEERLKERLV